MRYLLSLLVIAFLLQSCEVLCPKTSIIGGFGHANIVGESSWKHKLGGQLSVESRILDFSKQTGLSAGLGYSAQGAAYDDYVSGKVQLGYVNVPLLFSFRSQGGFYAEGGLQPAFLVTAKDNYGGNSYDYKDAMKKFELGVPVGAGYRTNNGFGFGARVIPGLTKNHQDGDSRNLLVMGILSYRFQGKGKEKAKD